MNLSTRRQEMLEGKQFTCRGQSHRSSMRRSNGLRLVKFVVANLLDLLRTSIPSFPAFSCSSTRMATFRIEDFTTRRSRPTRRRRKRNRSLKAISNCFNSEFSARLVQKSPKFFPVLMEVNTLSDLPRTTCLRLVNALRTPSSETTLSVVIELLNKFEGNCQLTSIRRRKMMTSVRLSLM